MSEAEKVLSVLFVILGVVAGMTGGLVSVLLVAASFGVGILFPGMEADDE